MLLEPELLEPVQPDVTWSRRWSASGASCPTKTRETARAVVRRVVEELERRLPRPRRR